MRNAPGDSSKTTRTVPGTPRTAQPHALAQTSTAGSPTDSKTRNPRSQGHHPGNSFKVDSSCVALPEPWLADQPATQQVEWRTRTAAVEHAARKKLERLADELALTPAQCDRIFPLIVRSTPGYDPVMLTGGNLTDGNLTAKTTAAAKEEIHQVLDPQQQALVENQEVNRQLWWQDTLARLEADLIESTGGVAATPAAAPAATSAAAPADSPPATTGERVAPEARENGNLFDILDP
jgi:hypothetical protein